MKELCDALEDQKLSLEILNLSSIIIYNYIECNIFSKGINYLSKILKNGKIPVLRNLILSCIKKYIKLIQLDQKEQHIYPNT